MREATERVKWTRLFFVLKYLAIPVGYWNRTGSQGLIPPVSSCTVKSCQFRAEASYGSHLSERGGSHQAEPAETRALAQPPTPRGVTNPRADLQQLGQAGPAPEPLSVWDPPSVQTGVQLRKFLRLRAQQGSKSIPDLNTLQPSELFRFTSLSFIVSLSQTRGWQIWIKGFRDQL